MPKRPPKTSQFELARAAFLTAQDGATRYASFRKMSDLIWPDLEWNPWKEHQIKSLCDDRSETRMGTTTIRVISWTGSGGSGKTHSSAHFAMGFFLAAPDHTCVTLTSTSKQSMGARVWGVISDLWMSAINPDTGYKFPWHLINSRKVLQRVQGDEKFNVACYAVESGELLKSVDQIKGRHTARMLLIVDEANSTPEAIFHVIPNMMLGCMELVILVIGNALSYYDNHGRACEPMEGWPSITIEDMEWKTKGVADWQLPPGLCCHYDGDKSPNVLAGKTIYRHIYSYENWKRSEGVLKNSISYWSQNRGFWPPEGVVNTVFSDPLIARCDGTGFLDFVAGRVVYAFLDPAFGGDRCVLRMADVGELESGMHGIQIRPPIYIEPTINDESERDHQIARRVIEECRDAGVKPAQFGSDATGIGRGVHAIIAAEWSSEIVRVEWGGKASDKPSSQADGRPAHEVYDSRVTELWFRGREFLEAGQLKGLNAEDCKQLCSRKYVIKGRKFRLDSKDDCKKALGYSPDDADAIAGICDVVSCNGITPHGRMATQVDTEWNRLAKVAEKELALAEEPEFVEQRQGFVESEIGIQYRDW